MKWLKRIRVLVLYDRKTILLLTEAFLFLGWARILITLPFSKVAPSLGAKSEETTYSDTLDNNRVIKDISQAVNVVSKYTLWDSMCLARGIAGMKMLKRRRIASTLYLGTAKGENGGLIAHAWLRSGSYYLTGADVMQKFIIVEKFANKPI
ncbi:lasso peptide biosynthesis B2 protein [Paenibacillus harenae]|uniref:Microcin J25-processing protein McjB C-terminal domain-containing protein n=1 Tax=Paenibacillus harenae TaxID=306543 RepID=A0ABT9U597_PAEHA|nr:lasso peptide biosynthesis B2 protein [Paenibacillus harenae]MDQ0114815.1 hypothetical protein [Paenibacillus harenae]